MFQIGHYFAERHKWDEAVQYYEKASNTERLVQCYYILEDYPSLENLIDILQPNDPLLMTLGQMFASVGMGKQAVEAFLKNNKISNAIGKSFSAKIQIIMCHSNLLYKIGFFKCTSRIITNLNSYLVIPLDT